MDFYAMLMVMAMAKQPILIQKPVHNTQGQQAQIAQVVNMPNAAAIPPQPRPNRQPPPQKKEGLKKQF